MEDDGTILKQVLENARKTTSGEFANVHSRPPATIGVALMKLWMAIKAERAAADMIIQKMSDRALCGENLVTNLNRSQQDE